MYKNFFGLKEKPFKLVPNPAYLFLSRSHEEALAHLRYAISQGDGFVLITGEVGTGKTILCRAFLEYLNDKTEAAFIFNPKLDSIQLLKAINDEFEISSAADNTKDLIDILNSFLMDKKAEGKSAILLIDEAHDLTQQVLEQLRLLSNLETSVSKLLQIILVGQPELADMLDSYELRQLAQRITLSCHLSPLTNKETREYIQHRINIAAQKAGVRFTPMAFRLIYRHSKGVPRLINIACDRTLLTAFGLNRQKITGNIAGAAISELTARGDSRIYGLVKEKKKVLLFSVLCLILFAIFFYNPAFIDHSKLPGDVENIPPEISQVEPLEMKAEVAAVPRAKPIKADVPVVVVPEPVPDLKDILKDMNATVSRRKTLGIALDLWDTDSKIKPYLDSIYENRNFFRLAAAQNGFSTIRTGFNLNLIKKLNLPAIVGLHPPGNQPVVYLAICRIEDDRIMLRGGNGIRAIEVKKEELERYNSGVIYILWKNFNSYFGEIPIDMPPDSVITLKMLLRDLGFDEIEISRFMMK